MKTPDEIKRGLECHAKGECNATCPYFAMQNGCSPHFILDALTRIRQLEARQTVEWIPVSARLPAPGERVLICLENGFVGEGYLMHKGKWGRYDELGSVEEIFHCSVSHWMPMPKAKQEETENE